MRILLGGNKKFYFSLLLIISLALGMVAGIFFCFFYSDAKENRLLPVYQVETSEAKVALTFDVAWEDSDLEEIFWKWVTKPFQYPSPYPKTIYGRFVAGYRKMC